MHWTNKQISIMAIVAITSFMGTFLISSINIALPTIGKSLGLDAVTLSWVVTSFLLSTAMLLLPVGRWGDLTGNRKLFKYGVIIFTIASLICSIAGSGIWLIIFRFFQGVGSALTMTTGPAILLTSFPPQNRGRVIGISVSSVYLGLAFGPFVGGMMTQYIGWRSIFLLACSLGIITTIITFIYLGNDEQSEFNSKKMDLKGTFFYILGLPALVYGSSHIPETFAWLLMIFGLFLLIIFWLMENRSALPVLDTKLFTHNHLFAYSNLAALINYSATSAIVFFLSLYLQKVQGFSPRNAGIILVAQPIMMAIFSPIAGKLSDSIQPRYFTTIGMSMCTIGLAALSFLGESSPVWLIVIILLWVGLGFALFSSPNMSTIMSSVNKSQYGIASGTASSMRVLGQIISMTIVTLYFAGMFGHQAIQSVSHSLFLVVMKWGFLTFSLLSVAGIYFSVNRGNVHREHHTN